MTERTRPFVAIGLALVLPCGAGAADGDFARDVRPILQKNCFRCHGEKKQEGGLRLDVRRRAFAGGDTAPAVAPGKDGELLKRITARDEKLAMPPGDPLSDADVATLKAWVAQGAPWPDALAGKEPAADHWAFRPLKRPPVPAARGATTDVDRFVLAKLNAGGPSPAPAADKRTLVRRLHLDLVGLPPTPEEVKRFLDDNSADAYEKLVDRLLASPHFGERWGRHWLDLARFAESDGYENDRIRPDAWRFRDWVIAAVNSDVPFDRFTIEQLAGDLLPGATNEQKVAAGFHRHTLWNSAASADKEEFRTFAIKDRTDTTGLVWMGLTVGCAQCHSHKYDPLAHREYYQLYAFFNRTDNAEVKLEGKSAIATLKAVERETRVHIRGNFLQPGPVVKPGTPAFLPPLKPRGDVADRLDLARWLVAPAHPLTARVAANHVWQHLFGVGLVPTPENFGLNGTRPRHPELLDWLATEFVRLKWSRKALVRTIVLSATYRRSSRRPPDTTTDPNNELLSRQNRYRVEAEIVRDAALAASGLLSTKTGGPSIVPPFPEGLLEQKFTNEALKLPGPDRHRRGVYIHVQRTLPHPTLATFDGADGNAPCPRRDRSITPLQALTLLNDPVYVECARALGDRVRKAGENDESRLRFAFELCLGRPPTDRERTVLAALVQRQRKLGATDDAVWFGVARTLLNLEEFTTRE
ncbi:MAG: PSD1 domain-containing protein [Planctomycetes bacterium]|nr:PSD1 domain-containing protein [Planctomycetota bacterium]